jgi:phosphoribosylglycinamide formyltransferase-1
MRAKDVLWLIGNLKTQLLEGKASMANPKLLVLASGSATGGGSGAENLVLSSRKGLLQADIAAFVSHHEHGGVRMRADKLQIPFVHFPSPWTRERYHALVREQECDFIALSGWLKLTLGLDPKTTFNIHPGPLPEFGGKGMHGHHVHEALLKAYHASRTKYSAVSMHFVTEQYDRGPVFFHMPVEIFPDDSVESLGARVNAAEHYWQPSITNLVVQGCISWDGQSHGSLKVPKVYQFLP